jgi:chromosome segregation ATPase
LLKNWFLNAGIAFSCGAGLAIILSSGNPLLIGLQTSVAALVSTTALLAIDRQRQQQLLKRWQGRIGQLQGAARQLQEKLDGNLDLKDRLLIQVMNHQQQVSALDAARQRLTQEAEQLEEQLVSLRAEKLHLQQKMDRTAIDRLQLEEGKLELAAKISTQAEDRQSLAAELEVIRSEQQQLQNHVNQLKAERDEVEKALANRQTAMQDLELVRSEQRQRREQLGALQAERQQIEGQIGERQSQLLALQEQENQFQQSLQHLQTQVTELNIVRSQVAELHEERQQLEQSIEWLHADRDQIIERSQWETKELQEQETTLQESVKNLQRQTAEFGNLQEQLEALYKEWQQVDETVKQLKTEEAESYQRTQELQERQQALLAQEQELQALQQATVDREAALRQSLEQLTLEHRDRQEELANIQPVVQTMHQSSQRLTAEVESLTARKNRLQQDILELQRQQQMQIRWEQQALPNSEWNEPLTETEEAKADPMLPRPTVLSGIPLVKEPVVEQRWAARFEDEHVRAVFVHLQKYGSLTEAELTQMLEGNPRKARQFALKFEEYLAQVPFSARVEVAASGKRYVRE